MNYLTKKEIFAKAKEEKSKKRNWIKKQIAESIAFEIKQHLINNNKNQFVIVSNLFFSSDPTEEIQYTFWSVENIFSQSYGYDYLISEKILLEVLEEMGFIYEITLSKRNKIFNTEFFHEIYINLNEFE